MEIKYKNKNMKTIQLVTAVVQAICNFGTTQFSIWDITKQIRKDCNADLYELSDEDGKNLFHSDVKRVFGELFDTSFGNDYTMTHDARGFRVFELNRNALASPVGNTAPVTKPLKSIDANSPLSPRAQILISLYLSSKPSATVKQIQSRLKGYPYTCREIADFLISSGNVDTSSISLPPSLIRAI